MLLSLVKSEIPDLPQGANLNMLGMAQESAERTFKIHSAPHAHKPPQSGVGKASAGVAQPRRNARHGDQHGLFQASAGVALATSGAGQKLSLEQV